MSPRPQHEMSVLVPPNLGALTSADPRTVGPYLVIGRVGAGGTGTVYAAVDPMGGDDPLLAVKVLHSPVLDGERERARLRERLDALAAVDGRVYVPPTRVDADGRPPWVAMPFVSGIPLSAFVRRRGPMGQGRLLALAAGLAEGLLALHRRGVAHGDLKPDNVFLGGGGPRILDCALPGDEEHLRRTAGAWLAPERHRGADPSPAADVFAWAAAMAFAASGRLPFGLGEPEELADRVARAEPDLGGVPESLLPLLRRALAKDPGGRPSVRELMGAAVAVWEAEVADSSVEEGAVKGTAVTKVLSREWQGVVAPARLPRVIEIGGPKEGRRSRVPLVAGGLAVAVALVGGGVWVAASMVGAAGGPEASPGGGSAAEGAEGTSSGSPSPEGPRVATVRFDPAEQPSPAQGPWVYTPVEMDPDAEVPEGVPLSAQTWSGYWMEAGETGQEADIPDGAEVFCANYCRPGPGHITDDRGTYPMTGAEFTDYLGWGDRVVIAEVEFAGAGGEGPAEVVRVTELFPAPPAA